MKLYFVMKSRNHQVIFQITRMHNKVASLPLLHRALFSLEAKACGFYVVKQLVSLYYYPVLLKTMLLFLAMIEFLSKLKL